MGVIEAQHCVCSGWGRQQLLLQVRDVESSLSPNGVRGTVELQGSLYCFPLLTLLSTSILRLCHCRSAVAVASSLAPLYIP